MRYLLDTDTVNFALRGVGKVGERLRQHRPSEIGVSAITVAELRFGAHKNRSSALHQLIDTFLAPLTRIPFDSSAADRYGGIAADLQAQGETIGMADTMIASQALELDLAVVTHNVDHFRRIPDLEVVDWYR